MSLESGTETHTKSSYTLRTRKFKKEDIVWAKVEGYPRWPATVIEVKDDKETHEKVYMVNFIGERSHATLPSSKLAMYKEEYENNTKHPTKALKKAIAIANDIEAGRTTQEAEAQKILARKKALAKKAAQNLKKRRQEGKLAIKVPQVEEEKKTWSTFDQEKLYLKEILSYTDPKKVLAGQRTVEKFIKSLSVNTVKLEQMLETKLGFALEEFYKNCGQVPVLLPLRQKVGKKVEELKNDIILKLFGMDTSCNIADLVEQSPDDEPMLGTCEDKMDQEENGEPMADINKERDEEKGGEANKDPAVQSEEKKEEQKKPDSSSEEEESDSNFVANVKLESLARDTILMISVCQEFTQLLEKCVLLNREKARKLALQIERAVRAADESMGDKYHRILKKVCRIIKRRKEGLDIKDLVRRIPRF